MTLQQDVEALYQEARAFTAAGRLTEAAAAESKASARIQSLRRFVEERPETPEAAEALLFLAERDWALMGDHPDVQAKLEQAVRIREQHPDGGAAALGSARAKLAEFHFLAARGAEAETMYRQALAALEAGGAQDTLLYGQCHGALGQVLTQRGREAEAYPHFAQAVRLAESCGEDPRVLYFLYLGQAQAAERAGRSPEAEALRAKALALLPKSNPGEQGFHV